MLRTALAIACALRAITAQSSESTTATTPGSASLSLTVSTVVASPSASPTALLPSQIALPPKQAWCPSEIFCAGSLLQTVNVANLYSDPKTFVDKPTTQSPQSVLSSFQKDISANSTEQQVVDFVDLYFAGEGLELEALTLKNFSTSPAFLNNVTDPLLKAFSQTVHGFWSQLIRGTNSSRLCDGVKCASSLIPLNHTFVVPGGRFREQYYWDSFWIVEGLIKSELFDIVNGTLQNFMDELEHFGFIPNGGRIYYLDRSQPPLFIQMLSRYVTASNDTSILKRALPLAEKELAWWETNRTISITSPTTNKTYQVAHYAVNNTAPRPESYLTDYNTANDPSEPALNETERAALYSELASGAETGWDYSTRWLAPGSTDLRSLRVRNTIPVDLNSILYKNHLLLADLYGSLNATAARAHRSAAASLKTAILDLFWNSTKSAFYDYNLATRSQNTLFSVASFYPLWSGIVPPEVLSNQTTAFAHFSALNLVMSRYNGTFPVTFQISGLQWDAPNTWPPHQYIVLQALRNLPSNVTNATLASLQASQPDSFSLVPASQLGVDESQLPRQPVGAGQNASSSGAAADINKLDGTVVNGGNATDGEGWAHALERMLANRYMASTLCSWHATGGSIEDVLPRLSDQELNVTGSVGNTGNMFEKFSISDVDSSGSGGEYVVQAGFGWTNGVVLWVAGTYGDVLVAPQCPDLLAVSSTTNGGGSGGGGSGSGGGSNGSGSGGNGVVGSLRGGDAWRTTLFAAVVAGISAFAI